MLKQCIIGNKGIILAADVDNYDTLEVLMKSVKGVDGITGIKVGFSLAMLGLTPMIRIIRLELGDTIDIIYDHQKCRNRYSGYGSVFCETAQKCRS